MDKKITINNIFVATNETSNALQHLSYLPFGEVFANQKAQNSSFDTEYKFLGKELDAETGFDYFGARYYVSELGIWLSVDPMSLLYPHQSPYAYCSNNPITRIDLNGMSDSPYYDKNENFLGVDEQTFPNLKKNFLVFTFTNIPGIASSDIYYC